MNVDGLIEKYNNEAFAYEVAFWNADRTKIEVYDEEDYYLGSYTPEAFVKFMGE